MCQTASADWNTHEDDLDKIFSTSSKICYNCVAAKVAEIKKNKESMEEAVESVPVTPGKVVEIEAEAVRATPGMNHMLHSMLHSMLQRMIQFNNT